jgi:hypothetical protein
VVALAVDAQTRMSLRDSKLVARDMEADQFRHAFTVRLMRATKRFKSIFWFGFTTWGWPRFRAQYFENSAAGNARFKFRFGLLGVAEYNDTTTDFSRANIIPNSEIRLIGRGPSWSDLVYTQDTTTGIRTAETHLNDARGTVKIVVKGSPRSQIFQNSTLTPNKLKWDVSISNFNFQYPTSKIAVLGVVNFRSAYNPRERTGTNSGSDADNADEVTFGDDSDSSDADGGRFAYVRQAWDRTRQRFLNVKAFPLRDDDTDYSAAGTGGDQADDDSDPQEVKRLMVFVFDRDTSANGVDLLWDPEISIKDSSAGRAVASLAVVLFAILAAFFAKQL